MTLAAFISFLVIGAAIGAACPVVADRILVHKHHDIDTWFDQMADDHRTQTASGQDLTHAVRVWVADQRRLARMGELEAEKVAVLEDLGVDLGAHVEPRHSASEVAETYSYHPRRAVRVAWVVLMMVAFGVFGWFLDVPCAVFASLGTVFAALAATCDLQARIIPFGLMCAMAVVAVCEAFHYGWSSTLFAIAAGIGIYVVLFVVNAIARRRRGGDVIGQGDLRYLAVAAAYVGWPGMLYASFAGCVVMVICACVLLLAHRWKKGYAIPLAPFISAGLVIGMSYTLYLL